jgi:hypothetical protein
VVFVRFKVGVLLFIALFIMTFFYMIASAQDRVRRIEVKTEGVSSEGEVIIMEKVPDSNDGGSPRIFIKSEGGATINMEAVKDGGADKRSGEKSGSREANQKMGQEGLSKGNIKESESVKMPQRGQNTSNAQAIPVPSPQANPQQSKGQSPSPPLASGVNKLQQYMSVIAEKNLFMPLGSVKREQKAAYTVTAVVSNTTNQSAPKAIIEQVGSNKSFYVSEGDMVAGEAKVTDIEANQVKLDRSGEQMTLNLGEGTRGGGGPGGPSGPGGEHIKGGQPQREGGRKGGSRVEKPSGNTPSMDSLPPFVRKILEERGISMEDLQNNPELREKLKNEMMQRFGGGGPGPEVQK